MSIYVNNKIRIKRNSEQHLEMKKLIDAKIFKDFAEILVISAIIGLKNNEYIKIAKPHSDGVLMQFFDEHACDMMDFIAIYYKKDSAIVKEDEKYEIFSSFANGGFPILTKELEIPSGEISKQEARTIINKYYKLISSNEFSI